MNDIGTSSVRSKFPTHLERVIEPDEQGYVYPPLVDGEYKPEIVTAEGFVCIPQFWELDERQIQDIAHCLGGGAVRAAMFTSLAGDGAHDAAIIRAATLTERPYRLNTYDDPEVRNPERRESAVVYNRITLQSQLEGVREVGDIDALITLLVEAAASRPGVTVLRGGELSGGDRSALASVNEAAFAGFTDYHPGNQAESREEFLAAIDNESTVIICSRDHSSGEIDGFMYFGTSVTDLPWLNAEFYEQCDTGHNQLFFTSIGSVDPKGGRGVGARLMETFAIAFSRFTKPLDVYFQCTNRSHEIVVPLIRGYAQLQNVPTTADELARVRYRSIDFID